MNNFLLDKLNELKKKKIKFPELDLRILLNKTTIKKKEIKFINFNINNINLSVFNNALKQRINSKQFLAKLSHYQLKKGPKNFAKNHDKYAWDTNNS